MSNSILWEPRPRSSPLNMITSQEIADKLINNWLLPKQTAHSASHLGGKRRKYFPPGRRKGPRASPAEPARRAMACLGPCAVGKRLPCSGLKGCPARGWHRLRGVSKVGAGQATSAGTPPTHSVLLWRPALFGQAILSKCSTMLLHTPGLLLCYENRTKHAKEEKLGGGRRRAEQPCRHTVSLSPVSSPALSSTVSYPEPPEQGYQREDSEPQG